MLTTGSTALKGPLIPLLKTRKESTVEAHQCRVCEHQRGTDLRLVDLVCQPRQQRLGRSRDPHQRAPQHPRPEVGFSLIVLRMHRGVKPA